jgi:outer membrane protein assembly factor BamB
MMKRIRVFFTVLVLLIAWQSALVLLIAWQPASAQTVKWAVQGSLDELPTALLVQGTTAYVGSQFPNGASWQVTAFNTITSAYRWQSSAHATLRNSGPLALAATSTTLYAVGSLDGWSVLAYDVKTGTVRWQDQLTTTADVLTCHGATSLALTPSRLFVGGCLDGIPSVRAYTLDGAVLWTTAVGAPGDTVQGLHAWAGGLNVVNVSSALTTLWQASGTVTWQQPALPNTSIQASTAGGIGGVGYLVLVGQVAQVPGDWITSQGLVTVLRRASGKVVWQDIFGNQTLATAVTLTPEALYIGAGTRVLTESLVRTYAPTTGRLLWEQRGPEQSDLNEGENWVTALAVDPYRNRLYVANQMLSIEQNMSWPDAFVRAYTAKQGTEAWHLQQDGVLSQWDGTLFLQAVNGTLYSLGVTNSGEWYTNTASWLLQAINPNNATTVARH